MSRLKFYEKEHELFNESYHKEICGKEIKIVFKKLTKHFKLNISLRHNSRQNGHFRGYCIDVPYNTTFGLLSHEIAHAIDHKKRNKSKHDKKFMRIIIKVNKYCQRKDYWKNEINKRTEIKIIPKLTESELQKMKILRVEKNIERCNKRLGYFTKLYTTKIKKYNRSLSRLKRHYENNKLPIF